MAKERVFMARNTGTKEAPEWELWYPRTTADAVMMTDGDNETKTIKDFVLEKINDLIGGAPATYDTLKEIADYIAAHEEVADALNAAIADKASKDVATTNMDGLMSKADKAKLNGIAASANNYVHPSYTAKTSGLYKVTVDESGHVSAATPVTKADITALGIPGQDTTYAEATTSASGLMSKADKAKLEGMATGANKYVHPSYTPQASGLYKITVDAQGHVSAASEVTKEDITALGIPGSSTTYSKATQTADGLMSKEDKKKLDETPTISFGTSYPENAPAGSIFGLIAE